MANNPHAGHRERLRNRLLEQGINESTPQHEILEVLLFYCIPRIDTNELAHELINTFGSLSRVLDAPSEELMKVRGINKNTITFFKLLMPIARAYIADKQGSPSKFFNISELGSFVLNKYVGVTNEVFSVVSLDAAGRFLGFDTVGEGDAGCVAVSTRAVVEIVIKREAVSAVICHNHPGGFALPSSDDISLTMRLYDALSHIGVVLIDHIIVADGEYTSMHQSEKYKSIFHK